MTNEELNKRTHEILGMCWHELYMQSDYFRCLHCNKFFSDRGDENIDFTTSWAGFGILIEWWMKHEKYGDFISRHNQHPAGSNFSCMDIRYISPLALAQATVKFFKEEQK